jgi:hypothetical protein
LRALSMLQLVADQDPEDREQEDAQPAPKYEP